MINQSISKSAILMLVVVTVAVAGYEMHLRSKGATVAYDDGPALWADKRAKVYEPSDRKVIFIGSSRIKYDLDIPTWTSQTGLEAIQLSCVGSSPRLMLADLANDPDFKGRLIVDVTEPLFFSDAPHYSERPSKGIEYYKDRTLAQRASFEINKVLESQLVFLDKDCFSMNAQLDNLPLANRPGVFQMPAFPFGFERTEFDRQNYMTDDFVKDPVRTNAVRGIWGFLMSGPKPPPMTDKQIHNVLLVVKADTDKIRRHGGNVLFVRTPSSGPFRQGEKMGFPRERYWDQLLSVTGCAGIHFEDYPETKNLICPEFSHLKRSDARLYTIAFVKTLSTHKGWEVQSEKLLTKL